jgi:tRNA(Glu) U13 pseudouridine synthase TruD
MKESSHKIKQLEDQILNESGVHMGIFPKSGPLRCRGGRRPLRVKLEMPHLELGEDERGLFCELCFALPSGSYATAVLREVFKEKLVLSDGPIQQSE